MLNGEAFTREDIDRIVAAYPKRTAVISARRGVWTTLYDLAYRQGRPDAVAWLLEAVEAFAAATAGADLSFIPDMPRWLADGRYLDDREQWKALGRDARDRKKPVENWYDAYCREHRSAADAEREGRRL